MEAGEHCELDAILEEVGISSDKPPYPLSWQSKHELEELPGHVVLTWRPGEVDHWNDVCIALPEECVSPSDRPDPKDDYLRINSYMETLDRARREFQLMYSNNGPAALKQEYEDLGFARKLRWGKLVETANMIAAGGEVPIETTRALVNTYRIISARLSAIEDVRRSTLFGSTVEASLHESASIEVPKESQAWSPTDNGFTSVQAWKHFKVAHKLISATDCIPGKRGNETATAIFHAVANESGGGASNVGKSAKANGWHDPYCAPPRSVRELILERAKGIPEGLLKADLEK